MNIRLNGVIRFRFRGSTGSLPLWAQENRMWMPDALEYLAHQLFINMEGLMSGTSEKNEPQMNADERGFVAPGLGRGAGSRAAGMREGRRSSRRTPYFCWRAAQEVGVSGGMIFIIKLAISMSHL